MSVTTPLIQKIKADGGTLYTFTSASKDLTKVSTNSVDYQFRFSKFVCLNLPYIMKGDTSYSTYINQVNEKGELFKSISARKHLSDLIIEVEIVDKRFNNIESVEIRIGDEEDYHIMSCMSDKKFQMICEDVYNFNTSGDVLNFVIRVKDYADIYTYTPVLKYELNYVGNAVEKGLYLSELKPIEGNDYNVILAEHFQNYILNFESVLLNQENYNPDLLNTPAERIFFKWLNRVGGIKFTETNRDANNGILYGEDISSYNMSKVTGDDRFPDEYRDRTVQYIGNIDAINQVDVNGDTFGEVYLYIPSRVGASETIYFKTGNDENYRCDLYEWKDEKIVGRSTYNDELPIDEISLDAIYDNDAGGNFYRGDLGYHIDFDDVDYPYGSIEQMNANSYVNFEFNCILIYYDLIDNSNPTKPYATNLYGVLFIDNWVAEDTNTKDEYLAYSQSYPKLRSSELDEGNSYGLKLALKVDTAPTSTMSAIHLDDNEDELLDADGFMDTDNDISFALYQETIVQLQKCIDIFYTQQNEIYRLQDRLNKLESLFITLADVNQIQDEVINLRNRLDSNNIIDQSSFNRRMRDLEIKIDALIRGKFTPKLAIDSGKLNLGAGLEFEKFQSDDSITITNTLQKYKFNGLLTLNPQTRIISNDLKIIDSNSKFKLDLTDNSNLVVLKENEDPTISDKSKYEPLEFNIDAVDKKWKTGQSFKFVAGDLFDFGKIRQDGLKITTTVDSLLNKEDESSTEITITEMNQSEMTMKLTDKSEIEVICVNDDFSTEGDKFVTIIR
ncbi:MAG: hypothetical protein NC548_21340 [Lachnospiraceae bacterium]|nr:hypothetical protein [Lachnospiraceae bacterium]